VPVEVETTATVEYRPQSPYVVGPKPLGESREFRVSWGVMEGLLITKVDPDYPRDARNKGIQGDVILSADISREGNVVELTVVSGHPLLVEAALQAVVQWKFKPYQLNGEPVEVEAFITVPFHP
jgi:periplasmic protein TonB